MCSKKYQQQKLYPRKHEADPIAEYQTKVPKKQAKPIDNQIEKLATENKISRSTYIHQIFFS